MKYIFLNLKRFDIPQEFGGVNSLAPVRGWASHIVAALQRHLSARPGFSGTGTFPVFFPEAHLLPAAEALTASAEASPAGASLAIGCQGVHRDDTAIGGNFGAFTTLRTANAARAAGCTWALIGHSEERRNLVEIMRTAGAPEDRIFHAVHTILNKEIDRALAAGLRVLYCMGETEDEVPARRDVLHAQLRSGLAGLDTPDRTSGDIVLAYEPVWAIGPGKMPPTAQRIAETVEMIREVSSCPLVYGGGLKKENAQSIGEIAGLDGGLIALTRFSGSIGFSPDEYIEIVDLYMKGALR